MLPHNKSKVFFLIPRIAKDAGSGSIHEMLNKLPDTAVLLSFRVSVEAEVAVRVLNASVQSAAIRAEAQA